MTISELTIGQTIKIETKTSFGYIETRIMKLVGKSRKGFKAQMEAGTRCRVTQETLSHPNNTVTVMS